MTVTVESVESVSKRVEANRRNATRSTGPRTACGKSRVRLNALKHGLTATIPVIPGEDPETLKARASAWKIELDPQSDIEEYLVERIAIAAHQLDRCDRTVSAKLSELVKFGPFDRDEDEAAAVADDARLLFWDPLGPIALYPHFRGFRLKARISCTDSPTDSFDPQKIVSRLEGTYTGCRWLLDRWTELRRILEDHLKWQAPDRLKAIRMLGRQPMDALADERVLLIYLACDAMDPAAATSLEDLLTETTPDELKLFKERVQGRGADRKKPTSPEAGKVALLALIDQAMAPLAAKMAAHQAHREFEAAMRTNLLPFDESWEGELLRRYQLSKGREFQRLLATYFKVRKEILANGINGDGDAPGAVEPAMPLAPEPVSETVTAGSEGTPVGSVQPEEESLAETPPGPEPCSVPPPQPEPIPDRPHGDETNPILAVASADETNPIPAVASADETNPTQPVPATLDELLEDLTRRVEALSAAGDPVPMST
jgi:hypothetical protein